MNGTKTAIIIVDMLNDFITGSLKCERGLRIIPRIGELIKAAHAASVPVIHVCDAHIKGVDKELDVWGDHAIRGSKGAEIITELAPEGGDIVILKRRYSGFFQTDLQLLLEELNIGTLIVCGLQAHLCVRHTAADAFQWGYKVVIPDDGVEAFTEEAYATSLVYMKETYAADITTVEKVIGML